MGSINKPQQVYALLEDAKAFDNYVNHYIHYCPDALCYCPKCGNNTFGAIRPLRDQNDLLSLFNYTIGQDLHTFNEYQYDEAMIATTYTGSVKVLIHTCRQCNNESIIVHHQLEKTATVSIIHCVNSLSLPPAVPEVVNFFYSEANKAKGSSAFCASMAMFRACVESILIDLEISGKTLKDRIQNIPPEDSRLRDLDAKYMDIIRQLGNISVHPNDNNIEILKKITAESIRIVQLAVYSLIDTVYIQPEKKMKEIADLDSIVSKQDLFKDGE